MSDTAGRGREIVSDRILNGMGSLADQLVGAVKGADGFVRGSPWQAVGAVALAGVAAGILVTRGVRRARNGALTHDSISEVTGG